MSIEGHTNRVRELGHESHFLTLCRVGFFGRGLLYILIAVLVLGTGRTEDITGALAYLNEGGGRLLLAGIAAGMLAYGLWRLANAAFGMEDPGHDGRAKRKRATAGLIGIIYLYLSYKAFAILFVGQKSNEGPTQQADTVLDLPGGAWILGLAAIVLLVAGVFQFKTAFSAAFLKCLDHRASAPVVKWLGRSGYTARGIIFVMVGFMIGRAALDQSSRRAGGMEEALDFLSGPLLYAVALGLLLFGVFSVIEAFYRRIHEPPMEEIKHLGDKVKS